MLKERLQILVEPEQRQRLSAEARRRGVSVGAVVRDAIDAQLGGSSVDERRRAIEEMRRAPKGPYYPPEELNRMIDEARDEADRLLPEQRAREVD